MGSTSTEVTFFQSAAVEIGFHRSLVHRRRNRRVTGATAQQHAGLGVPAQQVVLLAASSAGGYRWSRPPDSAWKIASRIWLGVTLAPGSWPGHQRGVVQRGIGQQVSSKLSTAP